MPKAKKTLEAAHNIVSVTLLPTGRLIMATEKRMYELVGGIWEPMTFADDPIVEPDPVAPVAPVETPARSWSDPAPAAVDPVYPEPNRGATYP
jgi:hypothetical protein